MYKFKICCFVLWLFAFPAGLVLVLFNDNVTGPLPAVLGFFVFIVGLWTFNAGWFAEIAKNKEVGWLFKYVFIPTLKLFEGTNWFLNTLYITVSVIAVFTLISFSTSAPIAVFTVLSFITLVIIKYKLGRLNKNRQSE